MSLEISGEPRASVQGQVEQVVVAMLEHAAHRSGLTPSELETLTGLTPAQVSQACWRARLRGLLDFRGHDGVPRYSLSPLGTAIGRSLKAREA